MAESLAAQSRLLAGRYRFERVLGRGGMGTVWGAHDEMLDRDVAVKEVVPPPELTEEQRRVIRERTLREARAAARIAHPNAVTVHDVVEEDGNPFIVMQLLPTRTLADELARSGPLAPAAAARIGLDLVDALEAAHRAGVLHRDVKPANVMLTDTGGAVLTDFGIATVEEDPTITSTGMLVGSPAYMAPERARGERPSPASDLWSLGATLFAAVEGEPPFRRDGQLSTLNAVLTEEPPPPVHAGPLSPVVSALLTRDPAARPDAAAARRLLLHAERVALQPPPPVPPPTVVVPREVAPTVGAPVSAPAHPPVAAPVDPPVPAPVDPPVDPPVATPLNAGTRPAGRRGRPVLAVAAAVVVAALAAAVLAFTHPSGAGSPSASGGTPAASPSAAATTGTRPSASPTAAPSTASSPAPSPEPSSPAPASTTAGTTAGGAVPAGFRAYADPSGFSLLLPAGWTVSHQGTTLYAKQPGGRAYLQVPQTTQPKADALRDWQEQEAYASRSFKGYQRVRLARVPYKTWDAADWEFLWTASGGQLHVLDRNVRVSDRRAYALYWSVPAQDWPARKSDFDVIAESFRPPGS